MTSTALSPTATNLLAENWTADEPFKPSSETATATLPTEVPEEALPEQRGGNRLDGETAALFEVLEDLPAVHLDRPNLGTTPPSFDEPPNQWDGDGDKKKEPDDDRRLLAIHESPRDVNNFALPAPILYSTNLDGNDPKDSKGNSLR